MNKMRLTAVCVLALGGCALLGGCRSADVPGAAPVSVVRESAGAEYHLTSARTGDLTLTESVRVSYFAARQKNYGFQASGFHYGSFLVSVGDEVKAGDVLATLDAEELDSGIRNCESSLAEMRLSLERNNELAELCRSRLDGRTMRAGDQERLRRYEVAIRDAQGRIDVLETRLAELNRQKEGRVITADLDGTVTFVRDVSDGETSVSGKVMITVTDFSSCAFSAEMRYPEALREGSVYSVTIGGAAYEITPTSAEKLGIEPEPMHEKSTRSRVYFALLTPSVNLNSDSTGSFSVPVESREGVVYVPSSTIAEVDGKTCVYVPDENGLCVLRQVKVGLVTSRYAEILEGLDAGESVIQF